jgi:hypothetical protein
MCSETLFLGIALGFMAFPFPFLFMGTMDYRVRLVLI